MLILKRKGGEGLRLTTASGEKIEIYFDQIRGGSVKTQTKAPLNVDVERIDSKGNLQARKNERHIQSN